MPRLLAHRPRDRDLSFARADVHDWLESAPRAAFDRVFSSYGAIGWLSDLATWARGIAQVLAPGGRLVLLEFHPELFLLAETSGAPGLTAGPTRRSDRLPRRRR